MTNPTEAVPCTLCLGTGRLANCPDSYTNRSTYKCGKCQGTGKEAVPTPKRYKNWCLGTHGHDMQETELGLYVRYEDYAALSQKLQATNAELVEKLTEARSDYATKAAIWETSLLKVIDERDTLCTQLQSEQAEFETLSKLHSDIVSKHNQLLGQLQKAERERDEAVKYLPKDCDGCFTMPDGSCISPGPCIHTAKPVDEL